MKMNEEIIESWCDQINVWQSVGVTGKCILEMTDAVVPLKQFLSELKNVLTKLEPREILSQFPSVPKFLHSLLNNIMVQTTEDLHLLVMHCVTAVSVSSQQHKDGINEKSIKWVKSQIKTVCLSYPAIISSSASLVELLGLQPVDITEQFNNELVSSLVKDFREIAGRRAEWSDLHRQLIPRFAIKGTALRNISEMCLPILTKPVVQPLIEALLCCEVVTDVVTNSDLNLTDVIAEQAISSHFLSALKGNPKDFYLGLSQGFPLSYDARVSLWKQDYPFFEEETTCLLEICCFERKYMSREEMKKIVSLRDLPKALSENTSLFAVTYEIIQRIIDETSGNLYVLSFVGVLLQLLSDVQRQKNKTQLADTFNVNYASIWSARLANFVNLLTVDWTDLPTNCFLHHTKRVEDCINEMCGGRTSSGYQPYYIWLILQGFTDLLQRCYWVVLFASDQFVETCLAILLWYYGGGTQFDDNIKIKIRSTVDTLRHLRNKSQVMTNDILCVLDSIKDMANFQPNVAIPIHRLITLFMLISCSVENLDFHKIFFKLLEDRPVPDAFDRLLVIVEETICFQSNSQWLSTNYELTIFSQNSLRLLNAECTRFEEYVSQNSQISVTDEGLETHANMINDLRSRIEVLRKLLNK